MTLRPGEPGYNEARRPFRLTVRQDPAEVVLARSADDVASALRSARERDLPFAVQATGHGIPRGCGGGVLVNLRGLSEVSIDGRVARVGGGTLWRDLLRADAGRRREGAGGRVVVHKHPSHPRPATTRGGMLRPGMERVKPS